MEPGYVSLASGQTGGVMGERQDGVPSCSGRREGSTEEGFRGPPPPLAQSSKHVNVAAGK